MAKAHVIYVTKNGKSKQHLAFYDKPSAQTFVKMKELDSAIINTMYIKNIHCFILPDISSSHLKDEKFMKKLDE